MLVVVKSRPASPVPCHRSSIRAMPSIVETDGPRQALPLANHPVVPHHQRGKNDDGNQDGPGGNPVIHRQPDADGRAGDARQAAIADTCGGQRRSREGRAARREPMPVLSCTETRYGIVVQRVRYLYLLIDASARRRDRRAWPKCGNRTAERRECQQDGRHLDIVSGSVGETAEPAGSE